MSPITLPSILAAFALVIRISADSGVASDGSRAIRCVVANTTAADDAGSLEDCTVQATNSNESPHCYVVFQNDTRTHTLEATFRGCWTNDAPDCIESARQSDANGACQARSMGTNFFLFCCCIGDMCNRDFKPLPPIPEKPTNASLNAELPANGEVTYSVISVYVSAPAIGLAAIVLLSYLGQRKRRKYILDRQPVISDERTHLEAVTPMLPLDSITLVEQAAQGSFGTVWRGMYHDLPVAVKIFPAGERQSWSNEEKIYRLSQMQHPNILRFIGVGQQMNAQTNLTEYWLLTTWHELGSLYDHLRFNTVSYLQLLHLADSIAKGVMHLHTDAVAGKYEDYKPAIAHRDIKSKNIILKDERTACIADFGLAIMFEPGVQVGTAHSQVGTRRYMSPEVLEGAISFDQEAFQRIDMYAVALVLWEILSRTEDCHPFSEYRLPFEDLVGPNPSMGQMQEIVANRKMRPPIKDEWRIDERLSGLIVTLEDCWDSDADARLSASTMHERLQSMIVSRSGCTTRRDDNESHRKEPQAVEEKDPMCPEA